MVAYENLTIGIHILPLFNYNQLLLTMCFLYTKHLLIHQGSIDTIRIFRYNKYFLAYLINVRRVKNLSK